MHITAQLDIDVVSVEADDDVTVMLELTAPESDQQAARPPQAAIVVLDRSGSMEHHRLESAQQALVALIDRLDDNDLFGLVAFDHEAMLVVAADTVGRLGREHLRRAIMSIHPRGSTDLSSGYLRGLQEARRVAAPAGTTILVLSDGHANSGMTDAEQFRQIAARAAAQGITTSTIGIGLGYDDLILSELAIGGAGNHTFAEEADAASVAVAGELDGLLSKTIAAASLLVRPTNDVVKIRVLNDLPSQGLPDAVLVELGDFYSGERRRLLVTFTVPALAALGLAQVALLELTYVSIHDLQSHTVTLPVCVNVVAHDVARGRVPDAQVQREKLILEAQSGKRASEQALRHGDVETARATLLGTMDSLTEARSHGPADELDEEIGFVRQSLIDLDRREVEYTSKKLSADRVKKSRGYRDRSQGGEY